MTTISKQFKTSSFGACNFDRVSPSQLTESTLAINLILSFDEALKLNLAIDECVRKLNRYNHALSAGKSAALSMVVHLDKGTHQNPRG